MKTKNETLHDRYRFLQVNIILQPGSPRRLAIQFIAKGTSYYMVLSQAEMQQLQEIGITTRRWYEAKSRQKTSKEEDTITIRKPSSMGRKKRAKGR